MAFFWSRRLVSQPQRRVLHLLRRQVFRSRLGAGAFGSDLSFFAFLTGGRLLRRVLRFILHRRGAANRAIGVNVARFRSGDSRIRVRSRGDAGRGDLRKKEETRAGPAQSGSSPSCPASARSGRCCLPVAWACLLRGTRGRGRRSPSRRRGAAPAAVVEPRWLPPRSSEAVAWAVCVAGAAVVLAAEAGAGKFLLLLRRRGSIGAVGQAHFIAAGAGIHHSRLEFDKGLFAQLGQVLPQLGLHPLHEERFFHLRLHLLEAGIPAEVDAGWPAE